MRKSHLLSAIFLWPLLFACERQEELQDQYLEITAELSNPPVQASGLVGTRAIVDENDAYPSGFGFLWGTNESVGAYGGSLKNAKFVSTNNYRVVGQPTFRGSNFFATPDYVYYPYREQNASNPATAVKGDLPSTQFYSTVMKKMTTDYKIGKYSSRSFYGTSFKFSHILNFIRYEVNADNTVLSGDKLKKITLTATTPDGAPRQLWGPFTMDITKDMSEAVTGWEMPETDANKLTLVISDEPKLAQGETIKGYLSASTHLRKGDMVEFEIVTDKHIARLRRTSAADFGTDNLIWYALTLANFSDLEVEEIPQTPVTPPEDYPQPILNSMSFTVANNPGKILSREFSHDANFKVTVSEKTEEQCVVNNETMKVTAYIPYLNNRTLVPVFEVPEGIKLVCEDGEIISGQTPVDFLKCKQIAAVNEGGEGVIYDVELTNTGLPVVVINQVTGVTSTETNSDYQNGSNAWYAATGTKWLPKNSEWFMTDGVDNIMVYNADGSSALTDKNGSSVATPVLASTRLRGNVTQEMPKKPFAVKLDKKHGMLGMPAHKRWVLLANWKDRTLMRNAVTFGLANVFKTTFPNNGMAWNPSGQFVELVYNGVHVGNYFLCEQIKIDKNRLNINSGYDKDDAFSGAAEDYGYLLESDDGYDEATQFTTANYVPFLFKDDGDGNGVMLKYASDFVRDIEDQLYKGNYTSAYEKMDLTSFIDFWLVQELVMNSETSHPKSCYSYINNGMMYAGPLWDFDWNTFPTSSSYSENGYSYTVSMLTHAANSRKTYHKTSGYPSAPLNEEDICYMWYPMLVKDAQFKNVAAERWNAISSALMQYADVEIPKLKNSIAKSEAVNHNMWPVDSGSGNSGFALLSSKRYRTYGVGGGYCGDEGMTFDNAVNTLQSTLKKRISGMQYVGNKSWPSVSYRSK